MYVFGFIVHLKVGGMRWREGAWKSIWSKLMHILRIKIHVAYQGKEKHNKHDSYLCIIILYNMGNL